jgi:flagellar motor switch protein FliN/FliY
MEQNEIDSLMKDFQPPAGAEAPPVKEDIGWDDVKEELGQSKVDAPKTEVSEVSFGEIKKAESAKSVLDLDFILDIPLTLTAELGRNRMLISELLQLGQGSVIELSKLAGEPMDIFVNSRLIARGEVVVVNEKFGIRLTDVVSPTERINRLR